jgi:hypothetical protein
MGSGSAKVCLRNNYFESKLPSYEKSAIFVQTSAFHSNDVAAVFNFSMNVPFVQNINYLL